MMTKSEFLSAYTGWLRADLMFDHWDSLAYTLLEEELDNTLLMKQPAIYLFLAHALLYSLLEFLRSKDSVPPAIQSDVDVIYDRLRRFRNAVFHLQDDFISEKFTELADLSVEAIQKVRTIHSELGIYLSNPSGVTFKEGSLNDC